VEREGRGVLSGRVAGLDGLRGLAVAAVLLFHAGHLRGGYLGVDLFFTLSGFLITTLLLQEVQRSGSIGLGGFWARRARRLLPALAILLFGVAIYSWALATPTELGQIRGDALSTLLYVANWHQIFAHQSYFALFSNPSPLQHTWSLAIEEQFYVIWPLLLSAILTWRHRNNPHLIMWTALALAALSTTLMFVLYHPTNTNRVYYGTDTRATAILLGAALAAYLATHHPTTHPTRRRTLETGALIATAGLALAWTRLDGQSPTLYRGGFLACAIAATLIIAALVHPQPGILQRTLSLKPLASLGLISYGVYLYHWPLDIILTPKRVGLTGWPLITIQTAITLTAATLSYHLIEQPIRHGTKLTTHQLRILTPLTAAILTTTLITTTAGAQSLHLPTKTLDALPTPTNLIHPFASARDAARKAPSGEPRILVVGNSVGYFLAPPMTTAGSGPAVVFNASLPGCLPLPNANHMQLKSKFGPGALQPIVPCEQPWEAGVVARFHPDIAISIVSGPADRVQVGSNWLEPCTPTYDRLYEQQLTKEVGVLGAGGAHVVILTAAYPRFPGGRDANQPTDCDNAVRRKVASQTGAQLIDLGKYVCPTAQCRTSIDGTTLRPDGEHYMNAGASLVARWILAQVLPSR
jgi:peptidoglycan/LPS O-acetylase OafA/YrhL